MKLESIPNKNLQYVKYSALKEEIFHKRKQFIN